MIEDFFKKKIARVYLAGPMTGKPDHNFPEFLAAAGHLRNCGYEVVNPAELEAMETVPRKSWEYYLRRDIRELVTCDLVAVLHGWEESRGACLEVAVGAALGMDVMDAIELISVHKNDRHPKYFRDIAEMNKCSFPAGAQSVSVSKDLPFLKPRPRTNAEDFVKCFAPKQTHDMAKIRTLIGAMLRGDLGEEIKLVLSKDSVKFLEGTDYFKDRKIPGGVINTCSNENPKENILEVANRIVGGDRADSYGHPRQDFERTAKIWSALLDHPVTAEQVGLCMIGVKMSRQTNSDKRDNLVDIAGYARTLQMVSDSKAGKSAVH